MITTAIVAYQCFPNYYSSSCQLLKELGKCTKNCKGGPDRALYSPLCRYISVYLICFHNQFFHLEAHILQSAVQLLAHDSCKINCTKCQADIGDQAGLEWTKIVLDSRRNIFVSSLLDYLLHVYTVWISSIKKTFTRRKGITLLEKKNLNIEIV